MLGKVKFKYVTPKTAVLMLIHNYQVQLQVALQLHHGTKHSEDVVQTLTFEMSDTTRLPLV